MIRCEVCGVFWRDEMTPPGCGHHQPVWFDPKGVESMSALDKQEGGGHYKQFKIQPIEYTHQNKLGFIEGNIVKYISRHREKNGVEDLRKIVHYCELLAELEYGEKLNTPVTVNVPGVGESET